MANDKPFLKRHAAIALGFHIAIFVCLTVSSFLVVVLIGLLLIPAFWVIGLVCSVMGAMAANKGENYDPPVIGPMIANVFKV